jgi:hypothetical protein
MPGMNGKALAQKMTRARPEMKVLYISGSTGSFSSHGELEAMVHSAMLVTG